MDTVANSTEVNGAIVAHVEKHLGVVKRMPECSGPQSVALLHVEPTETRPIHTIVTLGLSAYELPVSADPDAPRRLELMATLPNDWKLDSASLTRAEWNWPLRLLCELSDAPRNQRSLAWGAVVPNGDPPVAYAAGTQLCGAVLAPSLLVPSDFYQVHAQGRTITFFSAIPLYREEIDLHRREGMKVLFERLIDKDVTDVIYPRRKNAMKKWYQW